MVTGANEEPLIIEPVPTEEEVAAIVAALATTWQSAPAPSTWVANDEGNRWRFSGRWWSKPVPTRRARP